MTNRWCGKIGFDVQTYDNDKRRWVSSIVEKEYKGDVIKVFNAQIVGQSDSINENPVITNKFSIIANAFANEHYSTIRYLEYMGVKLKVKNISVETPRLVLSVGGVFKNAK